MKHDSTMKAESGIPIPKPQKGPRVSQFAHLKVGDSVMIEGEFKNVGACGKYQAAKGHGRAFGKTFVGRKVEGGVRIWRTE